MAWPVSWISVVSSSIRLALAEEGNTSTIPSEPQVMCDTNGAPVGLYFGSACQIASSGLALGCRSTRVIAARLWMGISASTLAMSPTEGSTRPGAGATNALGAKTGISWIVVPPFGHVPVMLTTVLVPPGAPNGYGGPWPPPAAGHVTGPAAGRFSPGSRVSNFSHDLPATKSLKVLAASLSVPALSSSAFILSHACAESEDEPPISVSIRAFSASLSAP